MQNLVYNLVQTLCSNECDTWCQLLGIEQAENFVLEQFLDMVDKIEEIVFDMSSHQNLQTQTEISGTLIKELAGMIYGVQQVKAHLAKLVMTAVHS